VAQHVAQAPNTAPRDLRLPFLDHRAKLFGGFADAFEAPLDRVARLVVEVGIGFMPVRWARTRSMLVMMSCSRARGASEGIHRLRLCARTHVRTEAVAPRDIDVLSHDLFEVSRDSCVRNEVVGHTWREIDEQVHVAVGSVLGTHDRAEYCDVNYAALTELGFVGAEFREDVREARHRSKPTPSMGRLQRAPRDVAAGSTA
jgi:hypothetical protein